MKPTNGCINPNALCRGLVAATAGKPLTKKQKRTLQLFLKALRNALTKKSITYAGMLLMLMAIPARAEPIHYYVGVTENLSISDTTTNQPETVSDYRSHAQYRTVPAGESTSLLGWAGLVLACALAHKLKGVNEHNSR